MKKDSLALILFNEIREQKEDLAIRELETRVLNLVDLIIETDNRLLSVEFKRVGYGIYKSISFVNQYEFGQELAELIEAGLNGSISHDSEKEINILEFREKLFDYLFENI